MKTWLIFGALAALAFLARAVPGTVPRQQQSADAPAVQPQPSQSRQSTQAAPVRHLSEPERAELRRQLHQFHQQYTRRQ
jgi:hypothetical protein